MRSDMGDDLDVDAMLEAPFKKEERNGGSSEPEDRSKENGHSSNKERRSKERDPDRKERSRDTDRNRDRDKDRNRDRDRDRRRRSRSRSVEKRHHRASRSRSKERKRRSRERNYRERRRSRSREMRRRTRSPSRSRERRRRTRSRERRRRSRSRSRDKRRRSLSREDKRSGSRPKTPKRELTAEERDARTVFCMQLSSRIKGRDLEDFFSVVGKITDVRIITDAKTRRSKGIAYVEFEDVESVPLALGLSGQKVLGVPIIVQPTLAEKNRLASVEAMNARGTGPMRLYVGSLHFNITEDMLRSIFEPFGKIDQIQLINDTETLRSKGYGFITFLNSEDAKKALEQLNGFELAGRPMKVNHVTERADGIIGNSMLDTDDMERAGIDLGATGRLQLMAKLAEGTGLQLPQAATNALNMPAPPIQPQVAPPIATQCFLLSNMFDPSLETNPNWAKDISDDVIEECNKHGGVLHVFVDRQSAQGNVYVKCPSIATAVAAVNSLHGRFFAGKMITAAYVPVMSYHSLFPDAMTTTKLI